MIEQYDEIVNKYDIHVNNAYKGRGTIILNTDNGLKLLKEVKLHDEKINFIYDIKNELSQKGFYVDRIIKSSEDTLYIDYEDKKYILNEWTNGREVSLNDQKDISKAIINLANIHKATFVHKNKVKHKAYDKTGTLIGRLKKHNQELVRIKNNIRKKPKWLEFDILFLEAFDSYHEEAIEATKYIESCYGKMVAKYTMKRCLNHGQYNQHNLLVESGKKMFTVNFEYASYDMPVLELYSILRKALEKNDWNVRVGIQAVEDYLKVYPLDNNELKVLYYLFKYPEKYWKISNYYASLNKAWKPKQSIVKLSKLLKQEGKKKAFIKSLYTYINKT